MKSILHRFASRLIDASLYFMPARGISVSQAVRREHARRMGKPMGRMEQHPGEVIMKLSPTERELVKQLKPEHFNHRVKEIGFGS